MCNQSSKVIRTEQQTSTGCQVTAVIGDNDNNRIGGVGGLSTLKSNWLVLLLCVLLWSMVQIFFFQANWLRLK